MSFKPRVDREDLGGRVGIGYSYETAISGQLSARISHVGCAPRTMAGCSVAWCAVRTLQMLKGGQFFGHER
jgi:hypothetical protein